MRDFCLKINDNFDVKYEPHYGKTITKNSVKSKKSIKERPISSMDITRQLDLHQQKVIKHTEALISELDQVFPQKPNKNFLTTV